MASSKWTVDEDHGDVHVKVTATLTWREAGQLAAELVVASDRAAAFRASVYPAASDEPCPTTQRNV